MRKKTDKIPDHHLKLYKKIEICTLEREPMVGVALHQDAAMIQ